MVVDSILIHAESGPNDHRKDAPLFIGGDFGLLYFPFENYNHGPKGDFGPKKLILVHFRREITVDRNRILEATPTRDLNSFKHFSRLKNKTLRT